MKCLVILAVFLPASLSAGCGELLSSRAARRNHPRRFFMSGDPKARDNAKARAKPSLISVVVPLASPAGYILPAERSAALTLEAAAAGAVVVSFPGRFAQRVRRSGEIRLAAERDADDLLRTPFHGAPPLTLAEIDGQRDRIEVLRISESRFQALRATQKQSFTELETTADEAAAIKTRLLRTFVPALRRRCVPESDVDVPRPKFGSRRAARLRPFEARPEAFALRP